jgi:dihydrofolate reductase
MRRILMFNRVTADGYFAGLDGELDWATPDDELDSDAVERLPEGDTILFGRRTYDAFESFWPHALADAVSAPDPHNDDRRTRGLRAMAEWIGAADKVVFSTTRTSVPWRNSRLLRELDPRAIEAMKRESGKDMMVFGSGTLVSQLVRHGLIDEYQFIVCPLLLGGGRALVSGVPERSKLSLLEAKPYRSGNVLLRYAPAPSGG